MIQDHENSKFLADLKIESQVGLQVGLKCPNCGKVYRMHRAFLLHPPIEITCRSCNQEFGAIVPVPKNEKFAETFAIEPSAPSRAAPEEYPWAPQKGQIRYRTRKFLDQLAVEDRLPATEQHWQRVISDFENIQTREDFLWESWSNRVLDRAALRFLTIADSMPDDHHLQLIRSRFNAAADFETLAWTGGEPYPEPFLRVPRSVTNLVCLLAGMTLVIGLMVPGLLWLAAFSMFTILGCLVLLLANQPQLKNRLTLRLPQLREWISWLLSTR